MAGKKKKKKKKKKSEDSVTSAPSPEEVVPDATEEAPKVEIEERTVAAREALSVVMARAAGRFKYMAQPETKAGWQHPTALVVGDIVLHPRRGRGKVTSRYVDLVNVVYDSNGDEYEYEIEDALEKLLTPIQ